MSKRLTLFLILGVMLLAGLAFISCSDDSDSTLGSAGVSNDVTDFFPVTTGYTTVYQVEYSNGSSEVLTYEVGDVVSFGTATATEWTITDQSGSADITYFVVSESELLFYENTRTAAERILALPLTIGSSWDRYASLYTEDEDSDASGGGDSNDKYDQDSDPDEPQVFNRSFPTSGGNEMYVETVESIESQNGQIFSGAIRLKNAGISGKNNYYWYVGGVGLVKYVIGGTDDDVFHGEVVGQLISYSNR